MRYITINELNNIIRNNIYKIPHDVDLVIGVPRSGMIPASMISLYLNTNLGDVDSLLENKYFPIGYTRQYTMKHKDIHKVLVVDDSINSGNSLNKIKEKLKPIASKYEFIYLTPIARTCSLSQVDIFFEIVDDQRIFEWNLFHHSYLENACLDLDGVLCVDPIIDDDGEQYINYIKNAPPLFIPTAPIHSIVTCRLSKYYEITRDWLSKYDIKYHKLMMLNFQTKDERVQWGKHGEYKGEYYKESNCNLFIESSLRQAQIIHQTSKKPVICIENNSIIH